MFSNCAHDLNSIEATCASDGAKNNPSTTKHHPSQMLFFLVFSSSVFAQQIREVVKRRKCLILFFWQVPKIQIQILELFTQQLPPLPLSPSHETLNSDYSPKSHNSRTAVSHRGNVKEPSHSHFFVQHHKNFYPVLNQMTSRPHIFMK